MGKTCTEECIHDLHSQACKATVKRRKPGDGLAEIRRLARQVYDMPMGGTGGPLHIVLDDGNLEDRNIQWCLENAMDTTYHDQEMIDVCIDVANRLLEVSEEERWVCYSLDHWGTREQDKDAVVEKFISLMCRLGEETWSDGYL